MQKAAGTRGVCGARGTPLTCRARHSWSFPLGVNRQTGESQPGLRRCGIGDDEPVEPGDVVRAELLDAANDQGLLPHPEDLTVARGLVKLDVKEELRFTTGCRCVQLDLEDRHAIQLTRIDGLPNIDIARNRRGPL